MTITRFLRSTTLRRRPTHLAIVVLPDEASAFQAYRLLQYHGISPEHLAIVGRGYSSPDRVGLMAPMQITLRKARSFATIAAISGTVLSLLVSLILMPGWNIPLVVLATGILSGFVAAVAGGLFGFLGEGSAASIHRHHLSQGRYLLMMEGPERLVLWGQDVLSQYSTPSAH